MAAKRGSSRWVFPKIGVFPPKSSILIGFSIIFTIHFGVPNFLGKHPDFIPDFTLYINIRLTHAASATCQAYSRPLMKKVGSESFLFSKKGLNPELKIMEAKNFLR